MHIRKVFAQNLRKCRNNAGLSQEELAHRAGVDRTYVSSLERGIYNPTIEVVDQLATAIGVDIIDLLSRPTRSARGR